VACEIFRDGGEEVDTEEGEEAPWSGVEAQASGVGWGGGVGGGAALWSWHSRAMPYEA
jgi:hypothetical protein